MNINEQMTRQDKWVKEQVIELLINEGYGVYAKRLKEFDFLVTDFWQGYPVEVALMSPDTGEICINPAFLKDEKTFNQLSVVVRHELLHFLLVHEQRFYDHLKATDPEFEKTYRRASIHELANYAMDWELSDIGYDDHDKEVVRLMQLNGEVLGGLILSDDHPEWVNKPMEEIFDLIRKEKANILPPEEADQDGDSISNGPKKGPQIPQAYADAWNEIMSRFDKDEVSDQELNDLISLIKDGLIDSI